CSITKGPYDLVVVLEAPKEETALPFVVSSWARPCRATSRPRRSVLVHAGTPSRPEPLIGIAEPLAAAPRPVRQHTSRTSSRTNSSILHKDSGPSSVKGSVTAG